MGDEKNTIRWKLREWARTIKCDVIALYSASRDPRVPWYVKAIAIVVVGYALSPIDLIPDFIPVFGYLDDMILLPLGIYAVVKLIPAEIMAEHRELAAAVSERPGSRLAAVIVVAVWSMAVLLMFSLSYGYFSA
ncbi:YkvA family protein [Roseibium aggregatum]|uniref:YkvA family protein n=1 Tax=Roseibium aggregatum TaxID=187304 RepID=UPI00094B6D49